jgi:xylulokinase
MKSDSLILSLDIGTSACKGALIDAQGQAVLLRRQTYPVIRLSDGLRVEQDPAVLWAAVGDVIRGLVTGRNGRGIAALSLSAQMSSHLLVDEKGQPLTRFITWMDRRAERQSVELAAVFSCDELCAEWGARLPVGPSWALPKLKWWKTYEPEILARARWLVQPKDWIVWKLSGVWLSDLSSLRGVRHQKTGQVSHRLMAWTGCNEDLTLPFAAPDAIAGTVQPSVARDLGLAEDTPVIVGWNDLAAGVAGATGLPRGPVGVDITGTSEHLGVLTPSESAPRIAGSLNEIPIGQDHELSYGVTNSSGSVMQWHWEMLRGNVGDAEGWEQLEQEITSVAPGAEGLLFLPTLDGERAPWHNPHASGAFFGIHPSHGSAHISCAVIEGITFILRSILQRLGPGATPGEFRVIGGASAMAAWNQRKADILQVPFVTLEVAEAGCIGAAMLAAKAIGWHPSLEESGKAMVRTGRRFDPNPKLAALFGRQHQRFEKLYAALEPMFGGAP